MKYLYSLIFTTLSLSLMNACDSDLFPEEISEEDCQTLVINLSSTGDGLTTRAGRPLLSASASQQVDEVVLFVVRTNTHGKESIILQKRIPWTTANNYAHGKQFQVKLDKALGEHLPVGTYTFYAIGIAKKSDYQHYPLTILGETGHTTINAIVNDCTSIDESKAVEVDFDKDFYSLLSQAIQGGEEVFAGKSIVRVLEKKIVYPEGLDAAIVLHRQVAGTLGYFNNIPAQVGGEVPERIRLIASNANSTVDFVNLVSEETIPGTPRFVINGSNRKGKFFPTADYADGIHRGYVVYDIPLKDFYQYGGITGRPDFSACDLDKDGYVGLWDAQWYVTGGKVSPEYTQAQWESDLQKKSLTGFWKNPYESTQQLVAGSVIGGSFLIPFRWVENQPTFELQLLGSSIGSNDHILKSWPVKIKSEDVHHEPGDAPDFSTGIIPVIQGDRSVNCFNVYRNHFYALGNKATDGTGQALVHSQEGNCPNDLNTSHELVIQIHAQWEVVENMTLK